jgi:formylglycine-generating enzyme required for sulfatase activity
LGRHAVYQANAHDRTWPFGQKRPNDLGFFDMHGNVWAWCHHSAFLYAGPRVEDVEDLRTIDGRTNRVVRGGSFDSIAAIERCGMCHAAAPNSRLFTIGLRVARTLK